MDALGIQTAILSLPNDLESYMPAAARLGFAREVNTFARQVVQDHPGRFGFFAHLPTPTDVDAALAEVAYALDELGADGVTLTNVYGTGQEARSLGDEIFEPLWAELDRRRTLVFLHGEQTPGRNRAPSRFLPTPVSEVPNETYKAAADLVTSGRKRQYPNVRIILSHPGGSTPFLASRVAGLCAFHLGCELSPEEIIATSAPSTTKPPYRDSKRTWSLWRTSWSPITFYSAPTSRQSAYKPQTGTPTTSTPTSKSDPICSVRSCAATHTACCRGWP
jgi:6-methylsalicylate decarboxylase